MARRMNVLEWILKAEITEPARDLALWILAKPRTIDELSCILKNKYKHTYRFLLPPAVEELVKSDLVFFDNNEFHVNKSLLSKHNCIMFCALPCEPLSQLVDLIEGDMPEPIHCGKCHNKIKYPN